jgi:hypothetical protein
MDRGEHPVAVRVEFAAVGLDQLGEGVLVAVPGRLEELWARAGRRCGR